MSIIFGAVTLSNENIARLQAKPAAMQGLVSERMLKEFEARVGNRSPEMLEQFRQRLSGTVNEADRLPLADREFTTVDLDKAWHGIHYLLTGGSGPTRSALGFMVSGGRRVADSDLGYGPARTFQADATQEIASLLQAQSDDRLRTRFDAARMIAARVYPPIWDRPPAQDDTLGWLMGFLPRLRAFLDTAATRRLGLVVWMQ